MVYELIQHEDTEFNLLANKLSKYLKYHQLEKSNFDYFWATIVGSEQRIFGHFKEVDMDMKTALKINSCIPESEKTISWD